MRLTKSRLNWLIVIFVLLTTGAVADLFSDDVNDVIKYIAVFGLIVETVINRKRYIELANKSFPAALLMVLDFHINSSSCGSNIHVLN